LRTYREGEVSWSNLHCVHGNIFCKDASAAIQHQASRWRDDLFNDAVAARNYSRWARRRCRAKLNEHQAPTEPAKREKNNERGGKES
jgi:hypothetical protein